MQGCEATICMPTSTPGIKIDAVRRLGGIVELVGESYSETQTYAQVTPPSPLQSNLKQVQSQAEYVPTCAYALRTERRVRNPCVLTKPQQHLLRLLLVHQKVLTALQ